MHRYWQGLLFGLVGASAVVAAASWLAPEIDLKLSGPEVGEVVVPAGSRFWAKPAEVPLLLPASGKAPSAIQLPAVGRVQLFGGRPLGAASTERGQSASVSASDSAVPGTRGPMARSGDPQVQDAAGAKVSAMHPSTVMMEDPPVAASPPPQPEFSFVLDSLPRE